MKIVVFFSAAIGTPEPVRGIPVLICPRHHEPMTIESQARIHPIGGIRNGVRGFPESKDWAIWDISFHTAYEWGSCRS